MSVFSVANLKDRIMRENYPEKIAKTLRDMVDSVSPGGVQAMTATAAVTPGVRVVTLDHTTAAIAATIADASNHFGVFFVKAITEPGVGEDHTLTLTSGTFDGTNNVATFADINDALLVYFDEDGTGTILQNTGSVALS